MANEVAKVEEKAVAEYGAGVNLGDFFADELDGLTPSFERIKIPAGGGLAFEVPGNDPESPDSVKEFKAVITRLTVITKKSTRAATILPTAALWTDTSESRRKRAKSRTAPSASSASSALAKTVQRLANKNAGFIS